jgi:uncharacterized protein YyaL (SSP411 family)
VLQQCSAFFCLSPAPAKHFHPVAVVCFNNKISAMKPSTHRHTNALIDETSPYLLQHAHNPVQWHAWNNETLQKAHDLDRMLLISIGYSACHWCHMMERETFENEQQAALMNDHFICIKVDREERPDVDAVYMNAVQLLHGSGGWPLNCFALPDGRPFYGGTYFRPEQWGELLKNIVKLFAESRDLLQEQADQILAGINKSDIIHPADETNFFNKEIIENAMLGFMKNADAVNGGSRGAPKFPMPDTLRLLLHWAHFSKDKNYKNHLLLTLDRMAAGGIYDQLGGGFARYAVDATWKVPHFEKMLYDNAQLITVYAEAFRYSGKKEYLTVATKTADFILRELTSPEGIFYSALDADSEGEEGKYYVWTQQKFDEAVGEDSEMAAEFYGVGTQGFWEDGKNILLHPWSIDDFANKKGIDKDQFIEKLEKVRINLLNARSKRTRPELDDKSLTSWNALAIKALAQLSVLADDKRYLKAAVKAAKIIRIKMTLPDGYLPHNYKKGVATINGFLEDYAGMADAAIELFQVTGDEIWIDYSRNLADYALQHFHDPADGMFWFTHNSSQDLVARKKELYDNVIPSSNSMMAAVLFKLAAIDGNSRYSELAAAMTRSLADHIQNHPASFANWAIVYFYHLQKYYEVVVSGKNPAAAADALYRNAYPAKMIFRLKGKSNLPIFQGRSPDDSLRVFVCRNQMCEAPVLTAAEAQHLLVY